MVKLYSSIIGYSDISLRKTDSLPPPEHRAAEPNCSDSSVTTVLAGCGGFISETIAAVDWIEDDGIKFYDVTTWWSENVKPSI